MLARTTGVGGLRLEAQAGDIQIIDEYVDDPNRAVFRDLFVQALGK